MPGTVWSRSGWSAETIIIISEGVSTWKANLYPILISIGLIHPPGTVRNPKRKRGPHNELPSLAIQIGTRRRATRTRDHE